MEKIKDFDGNLLRIGNLLGLPVYYILPSFGNAGNVIYFAPEKKVKFWDAAARVWKNLENTSQFQLTNSVDPGYELVPNVPQSAPNFTLRQLYEGAGVGLTSDEDAITIDTQTATFTLMNVGGGFEFVRNSPQSGTSFTTRNIEAGPGMTVSATSGQVILSLTNMNPPSVAAGATIGEFIPPPDEFADWAALPLVTPLYADPYFTRTSDSIKINGPGTFIVTGWIKGNSLTQGAIYRIIYSIRVTKRKILTPTIKEIVTCESRIFAPSMDNTPSIRDFTNGTSVSGIFTTDDATEEIVLEYFGNQEQNLQTPIEIVSGYFTVVKM